jgi:glycosyltransferase involved in cell wall biosynthesis
MSSKKHDIQRVLYVSEKAGFFGGVERYIYDTAKTMKNAGWVVSMMFSEEALDADDFLDIFDKNFKMNEIERIIAEEDFDLVIILKVSDAELVSKLRLTFNTSVCVSDHDYYCARHHKYFPFGRINCVLPSNLFYCSVCTMGSKNLFKFSALLNEIRKCRSFIVLSEFMRKNLLINNFPEKSIYKIYPVRELPEIQDRKRAFADPPVIMFAGQLIRGKGVDLMLRALALLNKNYHALIVGDGNDMDFLKNLSSVLGIADKVEFTGWQNDISKFWKKADIAVFPSRWQEPFGLTGIEAFAHRLPVVAFDVGGVKEWLYHGKNGLIVPPKDVVTLCAELEFLLSSHEIAEQMGVVGCKFVAKNFKSKNFINSIRAMIKETRSEDV